MILLCSYCEEQIPVSSLRDCRFAIKRMKQHELNCDVRKEMED